MADSMIVRLACPQCGAPLVISNPNQQYILCAHCNANLYLKRRENGLTLELAHEVGRAAGDEVYQRVIGDLDARAREQDTRMVRMQTEHRLQLLSVQISSIKTQIVALQDNPPSPQRDNALRQASWQLAQLEQEHKAVWNWLYPPPPKADVPAKTSAPCSSNKTATLTLGAVGLFVLIFGVILSGFVINSVISAAGKGLLLGGPSTPARTTVPDTNAVSTVIKPTSTAVVTKPTASSIADNSSAVAPSVEVIRDQHGKLNKAEWEAYERSLRGQWYKDQAGWVDDYDRRWLSGKYFLQLDTESPDNSTSIWDVQFEIPAAEDRKYSKDDKVLFSGKILSVNCTTRCTVDLEEVTYGAEK